MKIKNTEHHEYHEHHSHPSSDHVYKVSSRNGKGWGSWSGGSLYKIHIGNASGYYFRSRMYISNTTYRIIAAHQDAIPDVSDGSNSQCIPGRTVVADLLSELDSRHNPIAPSLSTIASRHNPIDSRICTIEHHHNAINSWLCTIAHRHSDTDTCICIIEACHYYIEYQLCPIIGFQTELGTHLYWVFCDHFIIIFSP